MLNAYEDMTAYAYELYTAKIPCAGAKPKQMNGKTANTDDSAKGGYTIYTKLEGKK